MSLKGKYNVTLLGLNSLFGQASSLFLKQLKFVRRLALYDESNIQPAKDLSLLNTSCRIEAFLGKEKLHDAVKDADVVIIGDDHLSTPHTCFDVMGPKICDYAKAISASCPQAIVVIAASPINILVPLISEALQKLGSYDERRVVGATAADSARANSLLASHLGVSPSKVTLPLIGGTSCQTRVPLISKAQPSITLPQEAVSRIINDVKNKDNEVFSLKNSPEALNKAYTTVQFLKSIFLGLSGASQDVKMAFSRTSLVPDVEYFSLPVQFGEHGIEQTYGIPKVLPFEEELIYESISGLNSDVEKAKQFLKSKTSLTEFDPEISCRRENETSNLETSRAVLNASASDVDSFGVGKISEALDKSNVQGKFNSGFYNMSFKAQRTENADHFSIDELISKYSKSNDKIHKIEASVYCDKKCDSSEFPFLEKKFVKECETERDSYSGFKEVWPMRKLTNEEDLPKPHSSEKHYDKTLDKPEIKNKDNPNTNKTKPTFTAENEPFKSNATEIIRESEDGVTSPELKSSNQDATQLQDDPLQLNFESILNSFVLKEFIMGYKKNNFDTKKLDSISQKKVLVDSEVQMFSRDFSLSKSPHHKFRRDFLLRKDHESGQSKQPSILTILKNQLRVKSINQCLSIEPSFDTISKSSKQSDVVTKNRSLGTSPNFSPKENINRVFFEENRNFSSIKLNNPVYKNAKITENSCSSSEPRTMPQDKSAHSSLKKINFLPKESSKRNLIKILLKDIAEKNLEEEKNFRQFFEKVESTQQKKDVVFKCGQDNVSSSLQNQTVENNVKESAENDLVVTHKLLVPTVLKTKTEKPLPLELSSVKEVENKSEIKRSKILRPWNVPHSAARNTNSSQCSESSKLYSPSEESPTFPQESRDVVKHFSRSSWGVSTGCLYLKKLPVSEEEGANRPSKNFPFVRKSQNTFSTRKIPKFDIPMHPKPMSSSADDTVTMNKNSESNEFLLCKQNADKKETGSMAHSNSMNGSKSKACGILYYLRKKNEVLKIVNDRAQKNSPVDKTEYTESVIEDLYSDIHHENIELSLLNSAGSEPVINPFTLKNDASVDKEQSVGNDVAFQSPNKMSPELVRNIPGKKLSFDSQVSDRSSVTMKGKGLVSEGNSKFEEPNNLMRDICLKNKELNHVDIIEKATMIIKENTREKDMRKNETIIREKTKNLTGSPLFPDYIKSKMKTTVIESPPITHNETEIRRGRNKSSFFLKPCDSTNKEFLSKSGNKIPGIPLTTYKDVLKSRNSQIIHSGNQCCGSECDKTKSKILFSRVRGRYQQSFYLQKSLLPKVKHEEPKLNNEGPTNKLKSKTEDYNLKKASQNCSRYSNSGESMASTNVFKKKEMLGRYRNSNKNPKNIIFTHNAIYSGRANNHNCSKIRDPERKVDKTCKESQKISSEVSSLPQYIRKKSPTRSIVDKIKQKHSEKFIFPKVKNDNKKEERNSMKLFQQNFQMKEISQPLLNPFHNVRRYFSKKAQKQPSYNKISNLRTSLSTRKNEVNNEIKMIFQKRYDFQKSSNYLQVPFDRQVKKSNYKQQNNISTVESKYDMSFADSTTSYLLRKKFKAEEVRYYHTNIKRIEKNYVKKNSILPESLIFEKFPESNIAETMFRHYSNNIEMVEHSKPFKLPSLHDIRSRNFFQKE